MNVSIVSKTDRSWRFAALILLAASLFSALALLPTSSQAAASTKLYLPIVAKAVPPPAAASLTVDDRSVNANNQECTVVRWQFPAATTVIINRAKGFVQRDMGGPTGQMTVCPSISTEFIATATNADGSTETLRVTVSVSGDECNRDPYIQTFKPTASQVNRNEKITVTWDVLCNSETYLKVGVDPEHHVPDFKQNEYLIEVSKEFFLRVTKEESNGIISFNEQAVFGVTVRPNTRQNIDIIVP